MSVIIIRSDTYGYIIAFLLLSSQGTWLYPVRTVYRDSTILYQQHISVSQSHYKRSCKVAKKHECNIQRFSTRCFNKESEAETGLAGTVTSSICG